MNRVWTNYCLRSGVFRKSPLADTYPDEVPRVVPAPPALDAETMAASFRPVAAAASA